MSWNRSIFMKEFPLGELEQIYKYLHEGIPPLGVLEQIYLHEGIPRG